MWSRIVILLVCLVSFISVQQIHCAEGFSDTNETNKWRCICSTANEESLSIVIGANCSSSCDCSPATGKSSKNRWLCVCPANGLPKVAADNNGTSCFTACNCNSGTSSVIQPSNKRISRKAVLIVLFLCVTLTTFAFIASMFCYVYRRDKYPIQRPLFSSDIETSFNSSTDLIRQRSSSVAAYKGAASSPGDLAGGCIPRAPFLFRRKVGTVHGTIIQFPYSELESATNKFSESNLIGVGGSSHVYCGHLRNGRIVAIKRIQTHGGPDAESAFLTEIELISRLHHCHVVPLLGYCSEHQGKHVERLLVFEYIANGNLREGLDRVSGKYLDWGTRIAIALGAARGLEYLHEAAAPRILHRDVKSTNILLDENWRAKITDLGMAKHLRNDGIPSCSSSPARMQGTFGYFAPEYAIVGRASLKSDVFSFGVVLLELITGRQPIHKSTKGEDESLVLWATPRLQDSRRVIAELPDPHLEGNFQDEEMHVMAYLAKECLLLDPDSRPTMSEVVQILSTIAPESKRKNFPAHLVQNSLTYGVNHEPQRCNRQFLIPDEVEEIKQITCEDQSDRHSLQLDIKQNIVSLPLDTGDDTYDPKNVNGADGTVTEYTENVFLLNSNTRSWRSQDDESVDLTEPRFESFSMPNVKSPIVKGI